ncbi:hypothetical protein O9G_005887 [Rozella allomycis CSF55]|uniref:Uncharacterized protein n=1 Tax=Rozella allomycis (strain CSF55) TaxID=988480 RepID=A0A075B3M9_ROZAC|nr:hypothetical protein O9G_005887 [Rozella allomycis CSF55]|eukprot:EPZ37022.1 hypothetical protein O9G_005887 [Rozella allomycis CSF55]
MPLFNSGSVFFDFDTNWQKKNLRKVDSSSECCLLQNCCGEQRDAEMLDSYSKSYFLICILCLPPFQCLKKFGRRSIADVLSAVRSLLTAGSAHLNFILDLEQCGFEEI